MKDDPKDLPPDHLNQIRGADTEGEPDFTIDAQLSLIPGGEYVIVFEYSETVQTRWGPKIALWFRILDGPYAGTRLRRFYNVASIALPPKRGGKFTPKGPKCHLYREWVAVCGAPAKGTRP